MRIIKIVKDDLKSGRPVNLTHAQREYMVSFFRTNKDLPLFLVQMPSGRWVVRPTRPETAPNASDKNRIHVRLTAEQKGFYESLGGNEWLREVLDNAMAFTAENPAADVVIYAEVRKTPAYVTRLINRLFSWMT